MMDWIELRLTIRISKLPLLFLWQLAPTRATLPDPPLAKTLRTLLVFLDMNLEIRRNA
jgi:hypothetical protein